MIIQSLNSELLLTLNPELFYQKRLVFTEQSLCFNIKICTTKHPKNIQVQHIFCISQSISRAAESKMDYAKIQSNRKSGNSFKAIPVNELKHITAQLYLHTINNLNFCL